MASVGLPSFEDSLPYPQASRFHARLQEISQRPEVEVQVAVFQLEVRLQLLHPRLELHERLAHALDLLVGQRAVLHAPQGLALHQLPEELDERQDELRETLLD